MLQSLRLLQQQLITQVSGVNMISDFLYISLATFLLAMSGIVFLILLKMTIEQTRLPGGRIFGLNCDMCEGKRDKRGKFLWRCHIKPHIVDLLIQLEIIERRK